MADELKLPEPKLWTLGAPADGKVLTGIKPTAGGAVPVFTAGEVADAILAERERCTRIADDEARIREEAGQKHVEGSMARERCFAGARAAANVAKGIRIGEEVPAATQVVLPHHIGTIFSDGYWNLNVDLRDPAEVEPAWRNRGQARVYTADQVREMLRAHGVSGGQDQTVPHQTPAVREKDAP